MGVSLSVAVECVLVTRSCGVPLRGLGFGLSASGPAWAGSYRCSGGAAGCGVAAMACTNHVGGWPGYRWGRGPNWATTGGFRPVTEIQCGVCVAVNDLPGLLAEQGFVATAFTPQAPRCAVGLGAAVGALA